LYPQLIETIKIQNATLCNIEQHNVRLNRTRKELFALTSDIQLQEYITPPLDDRLYRCRVTYAKEIEKVEYIPYTPKEQRSFCIVESDTSYPYKYANREALDALKVGAQDCDDVIISHNGILSDTTIANIAFWDGFVWYTPKTPLLEGTMRAYLLENGKLETKEIKIEEIDRYCGFAIMNAMVGFKVIKNYTIRRESGKHTISKCTL